jgi:CTP synthase (UTP-ammonia lyase)
LIELTRNLLGIADADSAENQPSGRNIVITPVRCEVRCEVPERGVPRLSGCSKVSIVPGSVLATLCPEAQLDAEFFCSFEVNAAFEARWLHAGVRFGARGIDGEPRALELPVHRFFVATLFQPQLSSSFQRPHPIVSGFLRACLQR